MFSHGGGRPHLQADCKGSATKCSNHMTRWAPVTMAEHAVGQVAGPAGKASAQHDAAGAYELLAWGAHSTIGILFSD
jgi:hypothetical protein